MNHLDQLALAQETSEEGDRGHVYLVRTQVDWDLGSILIELQSLLLGLIIRDVER